MTRHFRSNHDPLLQARVIASRAMVYREGPCAEEDRPPHVRAASGLSAFMEYLAVIQDDANWLALIDADQQITAIPLPPSPKGDRLFSSSRGNQSDKYDLEACITVPFENGFELVGFCSGSHPGNETILRVREAPEAGQETGDTLASRLSATFVEAGAFYRSLRENSEFSGAGLNIEGALTIDDDTIRLFQRGNAMPRAGLPPIDATADLSWSALCEHLANKETVPPPPLQNIRTYDLGALDGIRLTFSDAEHLGGGRVLFSASAEDGETGNTKGSILGIIHADGNACWTELMDQDGHPFRGKIEGLTMDLRDPRKAHFVIDDDDEHSPSKIYEAELSAHFVAGNAH